MLRVNNLSKIYNQKKDGAVIALDGVSIDFPERGMIFLLGKSGSGKSTLLNIAGGLDVPTSGEIIIDGKSSADFSPSDWDGYRNTYVGFIFQEFNILNEFTVEQNIELALALQGKKNTSAEVDGMLALVDMANLGKRKPNTLSGGQKQRVAIARALVKNPAIIMADEPTGSLDSVMGDEVMDILKKLSADRLVVVVSHDREFAAKYGDRVIELKDGKIISDENNAADCLVDTAQQEKLVKKAEPVFIKSNLPMGRAAKIGVSSLKLHPIRLAFTLFLAIMSFALFGVVTPIMTFDAKFIVASAMSNSDYSTAFLSKDSVTDIEEAFFNEHNSEDPSVRKSEIRTPTLFGKAELKKINDKSASSGIGFAGLFSMSGNSSTSFLHSTGSDAYMAPYYAPHITWFTDCGADYMTTNFGDKSLIAGKYPSNADEIAISQYHYEIFKKFGLKASDSSVLKKITSPTEIIGQNLSLSGNDITITGVYNVGEINSKYDVLKDKDKGINYAEADLYKSLTDSFIKIMKNSFHMAAYVTESFYDKYGSNVGTFDKREIPNFQLGYSNISLYMNAFSKDVWGTMRYHTHQTIDSQQGSIVAYFDKGKTSHSNSDNEFIIDLSYFLQFARMLNNAPKIISERPVTYRDLHPAYGVSFDAIEKEHSLYPNINPDFEHVLTEPPFETLLTGMRKDWSAWVLGNDKPDFFDKIYYGDSRRVIEVVGVQYNDIGHRESSLSNNYIVADLDFVKRNATEWSYRQDSCTTKYVIPLDGRYAYILAPTDNKTRESNYFFDMGKRNLATDVSYTWDNELIKEVSGVGEFLGMQTMPVLITSGVLGLLACLFLFNFISASIIGKQKDIGVLRALGARGIDVFKIFFSESFVIAGICFVFSSIFSAVACVFINNSLEVSATKFAMLNFGFPHILLLFGLSVFVSFIGTIIPVWLAAKKSPIDSIRAV